MHALRQARICETLSQNLMMHDQRFTEFKVKLESF